MAEHGTLTEARVEQIVPREGQPRQHFDGETIENLSISIRADGLNVPLTVRAHPTQEGMFDLLAGHRRLRACQLAGLEVVPVIVRDLDDTAAEALVFADNLHRVDLLPWEEGRGYQAMRETGMTLTQIRTATGSSESVIADRLAVAEAGEDLRAWYLENELTGRALVLLCELPNVVMSPKRCPGCEGVVREDADECPGCKADTSTVMAFPAGNPQHAAGRLAKGKQNGQVEDIVQRVRESYGLARQVVQTSLGLDDAQITQEAITIKTKLDSLMGDVGATGNWITRAENAKAVGAYTEAQKGVIRQQCEVWRSILKEIDKLTAPAEGTLL